MEFHRKFAVVPALLILSLLLCACGFQPLLGESAMGDPTRDLERILVRVIADRSGQILRNNLMSDLPPPRGAPLYTIEITLQEPRQEIAIRRDESASRVSYSADARFVLREASGKFLFSGSSTSSSTYEATSSEFASIAGHRSARDRALQEISADIRQQLAAYFFRVQRAGAAAPKP